MAVNGKFDYVAPGRHVPTSFGLCHENVRMRIGALSECIYNITYTIWVEMCDHLLA